ncbi:MAG: FAD-dependent oxidoreductase [Alphaproteobacteria bacterium]|nr:FAD-dependent oxidoreductase [Alphaproteobacteria bacterium]
MAFDHVLSPISIKGLEIKNRVVRTAHGTNLGGGALSDDLIAYHEARAKGGVGLSMLEASGIHPSGPMTLNVWDDSIIPRYEELMKKVRPHGMRMFSQLNHLGYDLGPPGQRPWSASETVSPASGLMSIAMSKDQIAEMVDAFARAAARAVEGGLDGVEIHCAHGFLIQQFLSPATNQREDEYGGSFENRMRFYLEVLHAVREAVGDDFILGTRIGPHNFEGGLNLDEHVEILKRVEQEGLIDYWNVSHGSSFNSHKIIGGMHEEIGYELPYSAKLTRLTQLPAIVTGRFRTLQDAEQVIAAGQADMVGMTRAHIADPEIVRKTVEGRENEIRPCIACNQGCVGGLALGRIGCTINVAAGQELKLSEDLLEPAAAKKKVLIVGGGPSGMEAARIAALRRHKVVLAESSGSLGGTVRVARRAPKHEAIGDVADWLEREMDRLNIDVRLDTPVDAAFVEKIGPDAVILATGASPRMDGRQRAFPHLEVDGVGQDHVVSSAQLLTGMHNRIGKTALVFDDVGAYEAIGVAEYLIESGAAVTFVTSLPSFAPRMETALVPKPALERLNKGDFTLITRGALHKIGETTAEISDLSGGGHREISAETVVLVTLNRPNSDLAADIEAMGIPVSVVGDAKHPDYLPHAFATGHMAARTL